MKKLTLLLLAIATSITGFSQEDEASGSNIQTYTPSKLLSQGQPSFAKLSLDYNDPFFGKLPANFKVSTYNLTWRLVQIQMSPANQAKFMLAKANALQKY